MTPTLPHRPADGHKGTFGTVLVVGGCSDSNSMMVGGPAFAALGALRTGAGRCVLAVPSAVLAETLSVAPSATGLPLAEDAIESIHGVALDVQAEVVGPGLGRSTSAVTIVRDRLGADGSPLVLDADGLNILAAHPGMPRGSRPLIVTPHVGEHARLASAFDLSDAGDDDVGRSSAAIAMADRLDAVVVLKGHRTVVADRQRAWVCTVGSSVLATGGTGDVLAGTIAGLLAQPSDNDCMESAVLGVWLHALAGERWKLHHGDRGLLAGELAAEIPAVLHECTAGGSPLPDLSS